MGFWERPCSLFLGNGQNLHRSQKGKLGPRFLVQPWEWQEFGRGTNMALCHVLATPGLSLTKSPGPSECTSRRTTAECPRVVGKWQKEAQELRAGRGSWSDLIGLNLWPWTAQADGQLSVPRAHRHYGESDESLQCLALCKPPRNLRVTPETEKGLEVTEWGFETEP